MPQSYRTHRSSGCGYGVLTELTEVPGTGTEVLPNSPKFPHGRTELTEVQGGYKNAVPVLRVLWPWATELTEIPCMGINAVQNFQQFFVG